MKELENRKRRGSIVLQYPVPSHPRRPDEAGRPLREPELARRPGRSSAPTLAEVARAADEGGVSTLTMMDHWFQMEQLGGPPEPMLEGYTSLGFLAGQTSTLELGLLVTGVTYRHPGLLAKIVTTLDVLSGGRAMLGIGAAWYEREHAGLGVPFPSTSERFERLEETAADLPADVERRRRRLRGQALPARRDRLTSRAAPAGRPARS